MPRAKKTPAVAAHFMSAFTGAIEKLEPDIINAVSGDLEDLYVWDEDGVQYDNLPREIPAAIRQHVHDLSKQHRAIGKQIEDILEQLNTAAIRIMQRKEREAERSRPHCKTCGQIVPSKKRT